MKLLKLSNNCDDNDTLTLQEIQLHLTKQRMIAVCNGRQQFNLNASEAEELGLALLKMAMEMKVRDIADATFHPEPIRARLQGITDRRAIARGPYRRQSDKTRARLGNR